MCKTASGDAAIQACTRAIDSKKFNAKKLRRTLSLLYTNRGVEYEIKKDYEHALADQDQAIEIDPKNPAPITIGAMPTPPRATTPRPSPISIRPSSSTRNMPRPSSTAGLAKRRKGDMASAKEDIAQAKALQPGIGATH